MLTLSSNKNQNGAFKFIGCENSSQTPTHLISNSNKSLLSFNDDAGLDICSFFTEPSDESIMAFGESTESCGSIASAGEGASFSDAGSFSVSSGGDCSGGCSYSC